MLVIYKPPQASSPRCACLKGLGCFSKGWSGCTATADPAICRGLFSFSPAVGKTLGHAGSALSAVTIRALWYQTRGYRRHLSVPRCFCKEVMWLWWRTFSEVQCYFMCIIYKACLVLKRAKCVQFTEVISAKKYWCFAIFQPEKGTVVIHFNTKPNWIQLTSNSGG